MAPATTRRWVLPAAAHRSLAGRTPATLWVLMGVLVLLSLASGALSAWAVSQHSAAASSVAAVHEPLSLDAQQMYEAVADADVTITGSLLASQQPPQRQLQRYRADIAEAAASLADLKDTGGNPQLTAAITTFSTGLPLYAGYVAQAQDLYSVGYPLTGGSFLQVACEEAHLTLLPAAKAIYAEENAATSAASNQATGLPFPAGSRLPTRFDRVARLESCGSLEVGYSFQLPGDRCRQLTASVILGGVIAFGQVSRG